MPWEAPSVCLPVGSIYLKQYTHFVPFPHFAIYTDLPFLLGLKFACITIELSSAGGHFVKKKTQTMMVSSDSLQFWSLAWVCALILLDWSYSTKSVQLEVCSLFFCSFSPQNLHCIFASCYRDEYFLFAWLFFKATTTNVEQVPVLVYLPLPLQHCY